MSTKAKRYIAALVVLIIIAVLGIAQILFATIVSSQGKIALKQEISILSNYSTSIENNIKEGKTTDEDLAYIDNINQNAVQFYNNNIVTGDVDSELSEGLNTIVQRLGNYKSLNEIEKESVLNQISKLDHIAQAQLEKSQTSPKLGIIIISISIIGIIAVIVLAGKFGIE
ncbi:TPA: hypothetical protein ACSQRE_000148 [Clostridium perfringens]